MSLVERFVIGVDIQRYSARVARRQLVLQEDLDRILDAAAEAADISRTHWECQPTGDGELAVLPADVDLVGAVRRFVSELDVMLTDHNEDHAPETRIRLRVAMHSGALTRNRHSFTGPALVVLQRLLDSDPVRTALKEVPEANLAQIISGAVHERAVVPELGGLRPQQFREVRVDLPAKGFREQAFLYVPGGWPAPPKMPVPEPPRLPFPFVTGQPAPRRKEPRNDVPTPAVPAAPPPAPRVLSAALRDLTQEIRDLLKRGEVEQADMATTLALLESAGRREKGWLRQSDGHKISDVLLTEIDEAWADHSSGAWGFDAQREHLRGLALSGRREFRRLSMRIGWRDSEEETIPRYTEFRWRGHLAVPFFPTLRNPPREGHAAWHDEWQATVVSVHVRLQHWER